MLIRYSPSPASWEALGIRITSNAVVCYSDLIARVLPSRKPHVRVADIGPPLEATGGASSLRRSRKIENKKREIRPAFVNLNGSSRFHHGSKGVCVHGVVSCES